MIELGSGGAMDIGDCPGYVYVCAGGAIGITGLLLECVD